MAQLYLEEDIQAQPRSESHKLKGCLEAEMWLLPENNPAITADIRKSHFVILRGNECIFWLGCNDLLVWSERSD